MKTLLVRRGLAALVVAAAAVVGTGPTAAGASQEAAASAPSGADVIVPADVTVTKTKKSIIFTEKTTGQKIVMPRWSPADPSVVNPSASAPAPESGRAAAAAAQLNPTRGNFNIHSEFTSNRWVHGTNRVVMRYGYANTTDYSKPWCEGWGRTHIACKHGFPLNGLALQQTIEAPDFVDSARVDDTKLIKCFWVNGVLRNYRVVVNYVLGAPDYRQYGVITAHWF